MTNSKHKISPVETETAVLFSQQISLIIMITWIKLPYSVLSMHMTSSILHKDPAFSLCIMLMNQHPEPHFTCKTKTFPKATLFSLCNHTGKKSCTHWILLMGTFFSWSCAIMLFSSEGNRIRSASPSSLYLQRNRQLKGIIAFKTCPLFFDTENRY